jgi:hypothetical protein
MSSKSITAFKYNVGIGPHMKESEQNGLVTSDGTKVLIVEGYD